MLKKFTAALAVGLMVLVSPVIAQEETYVPCPDPSLDLNISIEAFKLDPNFSFEGVVHSDDGFTVLIASILPKTENGYGIGLFDVNNCFVNGSLQVQLTAEEVQDLVGFVVASN